MPLLLCLWGYYSSVGEAAGIIEKVHEIDFTDDESGDGADVVEPMLKLVS
jgi:hypothetical protein